MYLYTCTFPGHYVGGAGIVIAESPEQAAAMMTEELARIGVPADGRAPLELKRVDTTQPGPRVLLDGDY